MNTFKIKGEYIHLNQLLKAAGLCENGGEANTAIEKGQVKVNGVIETRKRNKLRVGDSIEYDNKNIIID